MCVEYSQVIVPQWFMWRLRHLLNIHNKVICRALDTLDQTVCWSSVVACWLNVLGLGLRVRVRIRVRTHQNNVRFLPGTATYILYKHKREGDTSQLR